MSKYIWFLILPFFFASVFAYADDNIGNQLNNKMDAAVTYLHNKQNIPKAWELMVEVSDIIKKNPQYDDGEYAESMISLIAELLEMPWKDASPYLVGAKSTSGFQAFVLNHINDLTPGANLKKMKHNITKNCSVNKYKFCKKLIKKINSVYSK